MNRQAWLKRVSVLESHFRFQKVWSALHLITVLVPHVSSTFCESDVKLSHLSIKKSDYLLGFEIWFRTLWIWGINVDPFPSHQFSEVSNIFSACKFIDNDQVSCIEQYLIYTDMFIKSLWLLSFMLGQVY